MSIVSWHPLEDGDPRAAEGWTHFGDPGWSVDPVSSEPLPEYGPDGHSGYWTIVRDDVQTAFNAGRRYLAKRA
jgi:hypothetical protein